jgi:hypothetical protein
MTAELLSDPQFITLAALAASPLIGVPLVISALALPVLICAFIPDCLNQAIDWMNVILEHGSDDHSFYPHYTWADLGTVIEDLPKVVTPDMTEIWKHLENGMFFTANFLASDCGQVLLAGIGLVVPEGGVLEVSLETSAIVFSVVGDEVHGDYQGLTLTSMQFASVLAKNRQLYEIFNTAGKINDIAGCAQGLYDAT